MTYDMNTDWAAFSDADLAEALTVMYASYDGDVEDAGEDLILAESEVCVRAGISLDETEQGLSQKAVEMIEAWVKSHAESKEE